MRTEANNAHLYRFGAIQCTVLLASVAKQLRCCGSLLKEGRENEKRTTTTNKTEGKKKHRWIEASQVHHDAHMLVEWVCAVVPFGLERTTLHLLEPNC